MIDPAPRRAQVILDEPFVVRVVIPAPRDRARIGTRALFLAGWAWVWVLVIPGLEDAWHASFAIAAWVMVAMLALSSLLWHLRGAEVVDVREGVLRVTRIGGGWTRQWSVPLAEVRQIHVVDAGIEVTTPDRVLLIAPGLDRREAERVVARLRG